MSRCEPLLLLLVGCLVDPALRDARIADIECEQSATEWYLDQDGDGFGSDDSVQVDCRPPSGHVAVPGDCDDGDRTVNPGRDEVCDGIDNDCDGSADGADAVDAETWYVDVDGDGWGAESVVTCDPMGPGQVALGGDCDEARPEVNPAADEWCDGVDNDCDGTTDEGDAVDATVYYADADGDGYGDPAAPLWSCEIPPGHVRNTDDCDDADALAFPGGVDTAWEDRDCDGANGTLSVAESELAGLGGNRLGTSVSPAGDVNGDGLLDFVAGAPGTDPVYDYGTAWLVLGGTAYPFQGEIPDHGVGITGEDPGDDAGFAVAGGADVDGDGYDDIAVGSPLAVSGRGSAYLVYGSATPASGSLLATTELKGTTGNPEAVGSSVALGELTGDAFADLVVGAPGDADGGLGAGAVHVVAGGTGLVTDVFLADVGIKLTGLSDSAAGSSVAWAGDVDGDGQGDLVIGAPNHGGNGALAGAAYLALGPLGTTGFDLQTGASALLTGESAGDEAGTAVAGAGDFDGDGYADLLIGAPRRSGGDGVAYLVFGGSVASGSLAYADVRIDGSVGSELGSAVASAKDVDGDGLSDVILGAPGSTTGAAWVQLGDTAPLAQVDQYTVSVVILGEGSGDDAGSAVAGVGDLDGDGYGDLLIGGVSHDHFSVVDTGAVYLVFGDPL